MIFLIGFVSSVLELNCYSGQNYTFDIGTTNKIYWDVIGNSTNLDGLNITHEGTNIILEFSPLYISDSFTLIFFEGKTIIKEVSSGGGGSTKTIYKDKNVTKYIEKEVPSDCEDCPELPEPEKEDFSKTLLGIVIGVFLVLVFLTIYIINKILKKRIELKGGTKK